MGARWDEGVDPVTFDMTNNIGKLLFSRLASFMPEQHTIYSCLKRVPLRWQSYRADREDATHPWSQRPYPIIILTFSDAMNTENFMAIHLLLASLLQIIDGKVLPHLQMETARSELTLTLLSIYNSSWILHWGHQSAQKSQGWETGPSSGLNHLLMSYIEVSQIWRTILEKAFLPLSLQ